MPVLEGLWGPDLGMRDPSLRVGVHPDEAPSTPVWGRPLGTPPVTCGGLSLALELLALIRQLREVWRARRGGPRGREKSQSSTWVDIEGGNAEVEEVERDTEERRAQLAGKTHSHTT